MSKIARVYLNDVEVGSLPAVQYQRIVKDAKRDWRLYVLQWLNIIGFSLRCAVMCLRLTPWVWFYLSIIALIFAPEELSQVITEYGQATPLEVTRAYAKMVVFGASISAVCLSIIVAIGKSHVYGYVNKFDEAIKNELRRLLEVPTEGEMMVVCSDIDGENHHEQ